MANLVLPAGANCEVRLAGYVPDTSAGWRTRMHSNQNYQWVVIAGNRVGFQRGSDRLEVRGGDFLVLRPHETHTAWGQADPDSGFYFAQFAVTPPPTDTAGSVRVGAPPAERQAAAIPLVGRFAEPAAILPRCAELVNEWRSHLPGRELRMRALLLDMLVCAARCEGLSYGERTPLPTRAGYKATIAQRLVDYLDRQYQGPVVATQVSRELGFTYSYLCRVFRERTGWTVVRYLHSRRIAHACRLLQEGGPYTTVAEVAEAVGFTDPYYFSRIFHRLVGTAPRDYLAGSYGPRQTRGRSSGEPELSAANAPRP